MAREDLPRASGQALVAADGVIAVRVRLPGLMQVMMERDAKKRLSGRIEIGDADIGGERSGGKRGRGAAGKTPIIATVETTADRKPVRIKLRRVQGFRRKELKTLARRNFEPASTGVSGWHTS